MKEKTIISSVFVYLFVILPKEPTLLIDMNYCTYCGSTLEPNARFCTSCGKAVVNNTPPPPPTNRTHPGSMPPPTPSQPASTPPPTPQANTPRNVAPPQVPTPQPTPNPTPPLASTPRPSSAQQPMMQTTPPPAPRPTPVQQPVTPSAPSRTQPTPPPAPQPTQQPPQYNTQDTIRQGVDNIRSILAQLRDNDIQASNATGEIRCTSSPAQNAFLRLLKKGNIDFRQFI